MTPFMRTPLEQSVLASIRASRLLVPGDRVGVAVSGGGDSLALLRLLESLAGGSGNHAARGSFQSRFARRGIRGGRAASSRKLARTHKFEFVLGSEDVAAIADQNGWNLEDAGRRLRYAFFQRLVEEGRATRIAVAHTADDQAETVLAHICAEPDRRGLAGFIRDWPGSAPASRSPPRRTSLLSARRSVKHGARTRRTRTCCARARKFGSNCCRCSNAISLRRSWTGCPILRGSPERKRHSGRVRGGPLSVSRAFRETKLFRLRSSDLLAPLGSSLAASPAHVRIRRRFTEFRAAGDRASDSQAVRNIARRSQRVRRSARGAGHPSCDGVIQWAPCAAPRRHPCGEAFRRFGFLPGKRSRSALANA